MTDFVAEKLPCDLSSDAGLALIGKYLKRVNVNALVDPTFPVRSGVASSEILKSYLALLCLGKSDLMRSRAFETMPSSSVRWAWALFPRARPCASVWTRMRHLASSWPHK